MYTRRGAAAGRTRAGWLSLWPWCLLSPSWSSRGPCGTSWRAGSTGRGRWDGARRAEASKRTSDTGATPLVPAAAAELSPPPFAAFVRVELRVDLVDVVVALSSVCLRCADTRKSECRENVQRVSGALLAAWWRGRTRRRGRPGRVFNEGVGRSEAGRKTLAIRDSSRDGVVTAESWARTCFPRCPRYSLKTGLARRSWCIGFARLERVL